MIVLAVVGLLALLTVVIPFTLGAQSYTVLTGSMSPALEPGSLIAVRTTDAERIRTGDIITFQLRSGEPEVATHRVVGVGFDADGRRGFITQGDANDLVDEGIVLPMQIRGVLVYAVPWLGYLNVWATPVVKSLLVTVIGVAIIVWGAWMLLRDAMARRRLARAVVAAVVALAVIPLHPTAANAAVQDRLLVSADGRTWVTARPLILVDERARIVPGDERRVSLWLRNESADPASVAVTSRWVPADASDAADAALAAQLTASNPSPAELLPRGTRRADFTVALPADAGNAVRDGAAELVVDVRLQQTGDGTLPATGADTPFVALGVAGLLLTGGVVLLIVRARRRPRE